MLMHENEYSDAFIFKMIMPYPWIFIFIQSGW